MSQQTPASTAGGAQPTATPAAPNTGAPQTPQPPASLPPEIMSQIPEKFGGDITRLIKSYTELEKKLSSYTELEKKLSQTTAEPEGPAPLGARIEQQLMHSGTIDAETYQEAIKAGFSEGFLNQQMQAIEAARTAKKEALKPHSDGVDPDEVVKFFNTKLEKGEYSEELILAVEASIRSGKLGLWKEIVADYKAANAQPGSNLPNPSKGSVSPSVGGFKDKKEWESALKDRRYLNGDPSYLAEIRQKFDATPEDIRQSFSKR